MDKQKILSKFGNDFLVNEVTFVMGVHHRIAEKIALRFKKHKRVLDACVGAGFISIPFARYVSHIVAVDINPEHLKMAEHNAETAGVRSKISFILGDVSSDEILHTVGDIDGAFLDMDWSVGDDKRIHVIKLSDMVPPADLLFSKISKKTSNISIKLPKELDLKELESLPSHELQEIYMDGKLKFYMAYFGDLMETAGRSRMEG